jgi:hypothetical protein
MIFFVCWNLKKYSLQKKNSGEVPADFFAESRFLRKFLRIYLRKQVSWGISCGLYCDIICGLFAGKFSVNLYLSSAAISAGNFSAGSKNRRK